MSKLRVLIKEPQAKAVVRRILVDYKTLYSVLDGYIERIPGQDSFLVFADEEGKLRNKPFNLKYNGFALVGTVVFVGEDVASMRDITEEEEAYIREKICLECGV